MQAPPPPKVEEQKPPTDAEQLQQLLGDIGKKLETAWNNAINPPPGAVQTDPLLRFLSEFTNTPIPAKPADVAAATAKADQTKISELQTKKKDSLGFSVSEPAPKTEAPTIDAPKADATPPEPGSIAVPSKDFTETAARIYQARTDGIATKAEAGALIYSMAKEMRLAKAAGVSQDEISKTMSRMFGEFRIGVALGDDLLPIADGLGGQLALIGLMGDNPDAYEKVGLGLLGGKPPEPAEVPPPPEVIIPGSGAAAAAAAGGGMPMPIVLGADGQPVPMTEEQRRELPVTTNLTGQDQVTRDALLRQELLRRTDEQRLRDEANGGGAAAGGEVPARMTTEQTTQTLQNLQRLQDEQQRLQLQLTQDDQLRRDDDARRRR